MPPNFSDKRKQTNPYHSISSSNVKKLKFCNLSICNRNEKKIKFVQNNIDNIDWFKFKSIRTLLRDLYIKFVKFVKFEEK